MARNRKGQFIIIAAMLISLMIVSISTVIYGTVTYYRQERWEEYVTVIDSIKVASTNLLRVGLANYTQTSTSNPNVTRDYLNQWIRDVRNAYPGFGIDVDYSLTNGIRSVYGTNMNYTKGLARLWNQPTSYAASNVTVSINIASAGLTGYNFSASLFLKTSILDAKWFGSGKNYVIIYLSVDKDGPQPVVGLQASNFPSVKIDGTLRSFARTSYYSSVYNRFVYELRVNNIASSPTRVEITLQDTRGIRTVSSTSTIGLG